MNYRSIEYILPFIPLLPQFIGMTRRTAMSHEPWAVGKTRNAGRETTISQQPLTDQIEKSAEFKRRLALFFIEIGRYKITDKGYEELAPVVFRKNLEFGDPVSDIAKIMAETFGKKVRTEDEIIKEFEKRFANPTAKYLGNDFADYPKANIKDATDFLRQSLRQYRQSIEEEMIKSFREGKICAYCGQAKEPNLTELCNKCLEEN